MLSEPEVWTMGLGPELVELGQVLFRSVAGQDGPGHSANRSTDDPVRPNVVLVQMLISARQIGAERVPAPKHESRSRVAKHVVPLP